MASSDDSSTQNVDDQDVAIVDEALLKRKAVWAANSPLFRKPRFLPFPSGRLSRFGRRSQVLLRSSLEPFTLGPLDSAYIEDDPGEGEAGTGYKPSATWQKVVDPSPAQTLVDYPPRPPEPVVNSAQPILFAERRRQHKLRTFFWLGSALLLILTIVFGVINALGQNLEHAGAERDGPALQVTPRVVAEGATMTVQGRKFPAEASIALSRDRSFPVVDTGGHTILRTDHQGRFTDTITIGPDWGAGAHTLSVEDSVTHKAMAVPVQVTGTGAAQRPAHFGLSTKILDMGSGDQAMNSSKQITLINQGSGSISWRASTTQSWLLLAPASGTVYANKPTRVTVAVDRANLSPGTYKAQILFVSSAGDDTLQVQMKVEPLVVADEPVLQVSPPVQSFTAVDGGDAPPAQVVTVSNPGDLPLAWSASASVPWLEISPAKGTINPGGSQTVQVIAHTNTLLPGTYDGVVTFKGPGNQKVLHSPQTLAISMTITPRCSLSMSTNTLNFASAYRQAAPAGQKLNITATANCTAALSWQAVSNAPWLTLDTTGGTTPGALTVGIKVAGLSPGNYTDTITVSSANDSQEVLVNFVLGQAGSSVLTTSTSSLSLSGAVAQNTPPGQNITISNTGTRSLNWHASASTSSNGAWLKVSPTSGVLAPQQSAQLTVTIEQLATLQVGTVVQTYTGTVQLTGTDDTGQAAAGSPLSIPVTFLLQPGCGMTETPQTLSFTATLGQADPAAKSIQLATTGACSATLNWTAQVSDGAWLNATPHGTLAPGSSGTVNVAVSLQGLQEGTYSGKVAISAVNSVTQAQVGEIQNVLVTLNVQRACTLQAPSLDKANFSTLAGTNPANQTFSIAVSGVCSSAVLVTPIATMENNIAGVLTITPASTTITSGNSAVFTISVASSGLSTGSYSGMITLTAVDNGVAISGSLQKIAVTLQVNAPPELQASASSFAFTVATGSSTQSLILSNAGGGTLKVSAVLQDGAPSFVSLSSGLNTNVDGGGNVPLNVAVNGTGVASGQYTASVLVTAIDVATGQVVKGSPLTIPVKIVVPAEAMQLSADHLSFTTTSGNNPAAQTLSVTNAGGGTLSWTISTPSQSWLTVSPTSGTTVAGSNSAVTFAVSAANLTASPPDATVVFTPSAGSPVSVTVTLQISGTQPTPPPTETPTSSATAPPQVTVTPIPPLPPAPTPTTTLAVTATAAIPPSLFVPPPDMILQPGVTATATSEPTASATASPGTATQRTP